VFPVKELKAWFLQAKRSLPWRLSPTPYSVWISEVMLQQTQVKVVIPYFLTWMERFPTVEALAQAPLQEILKVWEGLGYYSRARRLHEAAQYIVQQFQGILPSDPQQLATIPGIGPYTQGAILSFAFHQKAAAMDGNVLRVLARYFGIEDPIDKSTTQRQILSLLESLLPDEEPWVIAEALIEFGALVCTKQAQCELCPLQSGCLAYQQGRASELPHKAKLPGAMKLVRRVAVIMCQGRYLAIRRPPGEVMADLYEFPYLDQHEGELEATLSERFEFSLTYQSPLKIQSHSFTIYRVRLEPHLFLAASYGRYETWYTLDELEQLPFSSGHRRILQDLFLMVF